jgi:hypothetical protein
MNIKDKFTKITKMDVSTEGWGKTFEALNKQGKLDQKTMGKVLEAICETTDEMYQEIEKIKEEKINTPKPKQSKGTVNEKIEPVQSP